MSNFMRPPIQKEIDYHFQEFNCGRKITQHYLLGELLGEYHKEKTCQSHIN